MAVSGYEVVANQVTSSQDNFTGVAACPSGKVVLGGGAYVPDGRGRLVSSAPNFSNGVAVGWVASVFNADTSAGQLTLNVYVICADA